MAVPFSTQQLNQVYASYTPSTVHVTNTECAYFFRKYLFQKAVAQVKPIVPDHWPTNWLMYNIFGRGYVGVFNTAEYGIMYDRVGLGGLDVFYQPSYFIVANPLITPSRRVALHTEGEIIQLQPDYSGIVDLCTYYGDLMALAAETAGMNLQNSKLSFVFGAENKAAGESFKKLYDNIAHGEPAVVVDKKLFLDEGNGRLIPAWQMFNQDVGASYIVSDILSDLRKIETMFDAEVGIPSANTDKRERLISDEVNANNVSTYSLLSLWMENLQRSCERIHRLFGLTKADLWFDWRFPPTIGGDDDGGDDDTGRTDGV